MNNVAQEIRHFDHSSRLNALVLHQGYELRSEHGVNEVFSVAQGNTEAFCASS